MEVQILHLVEGAKAARGLTVIIDVFRAFTVETYLARNHAAKIIPVGDIQTAFDYRDKHPGTILCGERKGAIIEGFDYGNSPSQIENVDFTGKTVVHTTSAGTQGIVNAIGAEEIIAGNLVCAKAIADYIKIKKPEYVSLVCMGLAGKQDTDEDVLAAEYIKSLVAGKPLEDIDARIDNLKNTDGAKFFDPDQQEVFPQRDYKLSTMVNSFPFVLRLTKDPNGGPDYMERINIYELDANQVADDTQVPDVKPGDRMSQFTRDQAICFPEHVKRAVAYGNYREPQGNFDAALVLGGNAELMESRAKAAAELYHQGRCGLFITTGGVCWDTIYGFITEAQALRRHMMDAGVPENRIITEDRATTTVENMTWSREILRERFGDKKIRLAVATSYFHVVRSVGLAKAYISNAEILGVRADYPMDDPQTFMDDPYILKRVTTECRCLWGNVKRGIIPDFAVL